MSTLKSWRLVPIALIILEVLILIGAFHCVHWRVKAVIKYAAVVSWASHPPNKVWQSVSLVIPVRRWGNVFVHRYQGKQQVLTLPGCTSRMNRLNNPIKTSIVVVINNDALCLPSPMLSLHRVIDSALFTYVLIDFLIFCQIVTDQQTGQKIQIVTALEPSSPGKQHFILANADYSPGGKLILAKQEGSPNKVILASPDSSGVNQLLFASSELAGQQIQVLLKIELTSSCQFW